MKRRRILATLTVIASMVVEVALVSAKTVSERPNILLVTADDLGLQMGCYGDPTAHTPHLDRLAKEGIRFTRAFVTQASCSPSRSSMLTGLYPHQNGQIGLSHRGYSMRDPSIPTLPGALKKAGYQTGIIGKLHVSPESSFPFDFKKTNYQVARDVEKVAELASEFLSATERSPFFLMVNFSDPHSPYLRDVNGHPEVKADPYRTRPFAFTGSNDVGMRRTTANYYCCVNRFDEGFGMLMDILERNNQTENTLIMVIGDHGPPFPRAKVTCYEAGLQIPWLVRWPGIVDAAQVQDAFVSTIDLMPTFLEAAGVDALPGLAGESLLPVLTGQRQKVRDYVFCEFTSHVPVHYLPQRTVRDNRYKLCVQLMFDPVVMERLQELGIDPRRDFQSSFSKIPAIGLYDLEADPHEFKNLAEDPSHRAILEKLKHVLHDWRVATQDPLLEIDELITLTRNHVGVHEKYQSK